MIKDDTSPWELLDFGTAARLQGAIAAAQGAAPRQGIGARFYNVEWKLGPNPEWSNLRAYLFREGTEARGFAPFLRQARPLLFHFGEIRLASVNMIRYSLIGDIYLDPESSQESRYAASVSLLASMLAALRPSEAAFFEGLPIESAIYKALTLDLASSRDFVTIQIGDCFDHQFISLPKTFQEYVQQMGSRSRQSVQYSARRLERELAGDVRVVKFDSVDLVDKFLADAAAISRKTYQTNLLGLGIHDDDPTRAQLKFAAERGWLRSYILYCANVPSAFMLGHEFGDCYYYDDVGYDPQYAKWSVGSVLQLKVLEDLIGSPSPPAYFDFSTGFGSHKGRFGNMSRREANLLVLPRTTRNRVLAAAYRGSARFSDATVRLLDRFGVKDKLKKLIRRRSGK